MISVEHVTKVFREKKMSKVAVSDLSFTVNKGEIVALLGENGAGKTTLLRMIATILEPSSGVMKVAGFDVKKDPIEVRKRIGVLFGGETGLYERLTARENLLYFASLYGLGKQETEERIQQLAEQFGMLDFLDRRVGKFSRGMRQKVAIARSVLHNPPVILFDEPTSGLDITSANMFRQLILQLHTEGKTILFSSHIMEEVKHLCKSVLMIHQGESVFYGSLEDLYKQEETDDLNEIFMSKISFGGVKG